MQLTLKYNRSKEKCFVLGKMGEYEIVSRINNEGRKLSEAIFDINNLESYLILRINTKSCQACITKIQTSLNMISKLYPQKVLIIGTFTSKTEYKYYKQSLFKNCVVVDLGKEYLYENVMEKERKPYFFRIDNERVIQNLFVPDKNFSFLTDVYLKNLLPCIN